MLLLLLLLMLLLPLILFLFLLLMLLLPLPLLLMLILRVLTRVKNAPQHGAHLVKQRPGPGNFSGPGAGYCGQQDERRLDFTGGAEGDAEVISAVLALSATRLRDIEWDTGCGPERLVTQRPVQRREPSGRPEHTGSGLLGNILDLKAIVHTEPPVLGRLRRRLHPGERW